MLAQSQTLKRRLSSERGIVFIETLMSLLPLLLAFLGILQLALLGIGQLVVQHAATRAARAAVVILDDDPNHYGGAKRGDLSSGEEEKKGLELLLAELSSAYEGLTDSESQPAGARLKAIQSAAHHALAVLGPAVPGGEGFAKEFNGSLGRIVFGRMIYAPIASAVTLHKGGNEVPVLTTGAREKLQLRVAFLMPCSVPLASALICTSRADLVKAREGLETTEQAKKIIEALKYTNSALLRDAAIITGNRFMLLRAEVSFVAQGAHYYPD